jgi:outer membrane lipoprotein-sorting protein
MKNNANKVIKRWSLLLTLCLPAIAGAQTADPAWSFEQFMQQRAQVQSGRATFVETRKLSGQTHQSKGVLTYHAPDRLERETSAPIAERIVIQNDRMRMEFETSPGQMAQREVDLARVPAMRPFFVALRSLLAGDLDTLRRLFDVETSGNDNAWRVKLVPRERTDQQTREIVFGGRGKDLFTVELRHKNGDSSYTTLTPVSSEQKTSAEQAPRGS